MEFDQGPDVDPEANPRHELARLRELAEEVNDLIKEFERLRRYLLDAQQAYHKVVYELPKDGGLRLAFTDQDDQFPQDRNIDGGPRKKLEEGLLLGKTDNTSYAPHAGNAR